MRTGSVNTLPGEPDQSTPAKRINGIGQGETPHHDSQRLAHERVRVDAVYRITSVEVITITADKLRLFIEDHLKRVEKRGSWIAPLGIFVAVVLTLLTSDFKDMGLSAATWEAAFVLVAIISLIWLVRSIVAALRSEKVEDIIVQLTKDAQVSPDTTNDA